MKLFLASKSLLPKIIYVMLKTIYWFKIEKFSFLPIANNVQFLSNTLTPKLIQIISLW